jgi:hypothetical protein
MTKREVVEAVALKTERAKAAVETVLDSVLDVIVGALHANERVDLPRVRQLCGEGEKRPAGPQSSDRRDDNHCGQTRREFQSQ